MKNQRPVKNPEIESSSSANASDASTSSSSSPPPFGKRSKDPEDEVYLNSSHSHKRYLSEIMASSLSEVYILGQVKGVERGEEIPKTASAQPPQKQNPAHVNETVLQRPPVSAATETKRVPKLFTYTTKQYSSPCRRA
ncbi:hypothetical protein C1H46_003749 [Malus baccata]|uniref:Uncharacterized protein n=1 Tax=Malus baccata TaxID=106549 RepID=A0A540NHY1_MALBA|nr:hypothetical protein C1H46_003749 [Malus baccata]